MARLYVKVIDTCYKRLQACKEVLSKMSGGNNEPKRY